MSPSRIGRRGRAAVIVGALVVGVLVLWGVRGRTRDSGPPGQTGQSEQSAKAGKEPDSGGGTASGRGARGSNADRVVPVIVVPAESRDVPIYLEGLGTVTAYKSVNIRTQVDGRLNRVLFTEGKPVRKGELLAEVDSRPFTIQLHTAEAALARDQAQLDGAVRNLERYESVRAERLIPEQQVDDQRALADQLRGTVKADQAQIENARLQLAYARITSPIDGITGIRLVDPGNVVHVADPNGIVVVNQLDPIAVLFTLPQDDLPRVASAQREKPLVVEATSRDGDQLLATGELALIDNQINQNTATMRLKAIFPNRNQALWPNQFVKVRLRLKVHRGALVVPSAAIQHGPQGTNVYVEESGRAVLRKVQVESIQGTLAVLSDGLRPGERVVSEGQNQLRPNARVAVREPSAGTSGRTTRPPPPPTASAPSSGRTTRPSTSPTVSTPSSGAAAAAAGGAPGRGARPRP